MRKKQRVWPWLLAAAVLAIVAGCGVYVRDYYRADETAVAAMASAQSVTVWTMEDGTVVFEPEQKQRGFIFYPGGKVEHTAYAPLLQELAQNGILCVLVKMPFQLAVLNPNAADGIQQQFDAVDTWYIGGHSLGGAMAANYAAEHSQDYDGVVLLAAYSTADLTQSDLSVLSVYGTEDQVLNMEKYEDYKSNLPEAMTEAVIEGGCHGHFGSYGHQEGDGTPTITAREQVEQTADYVLDWMNVA